MKKGVLTALVLAAELLKEEGELQARVSVFYLSDTICLQSL
jgi:hypothetical protein